MTGRRNLAIVEIEEVYVALNDVRQKIASFLSDGGVYLTHKNPNDIYSYHVRQVGITTENTARYHLYTDVVGTEKLNIPTLVILMPLLEGYGLTDTTLKPDATIKFMFPQGGTVEIDGVEMYSDIFQHYTKSLNIDTVLGAWSMHCSGRQGNIHKKYMDALGMYIKFRDQIKNTFAANFSLNKGEQFYRYTDIDGDGVVERYKITKIFNNVVTLEVAQCPVDVGFGDFWANSTIKQPLDNLVRYLNEKMIIHSDAKGAKDFGKIYELIDQTMQFYGGSSIK